MRRVSPLLALLLLAGRAGGEEGSRPRLAFDREEHDFGVAAQEQELTTEFAYRNDGDAPLTGLRAIADCGCYGLTLSHTDLEPGETGTLKVVFRTLVFSGPMSKRIQIFSNDPERPTAILKLKIEVSAGVILDPGRLFFGDVLVGTAPAKSFLVKWKEGVGSAFEVVAIEVPGHEEIAVAREPWSEGPWRGTKVSLSFRTPPPLGIFSATAIVRTDHCDFARLVVPLTANVSGRVWLQSRSVSFNWVRQGEERKTSIAVRPFSDAVALGAVSASARGGKVRTAIEADPLGRPGQWILSIAVPADAPVGRIEEVVDLRTEVPGEEVTPIQVRGEVLPPAR